ncbi:MAG: hypothetical protein WAZ31_00150 [Rectinemataceae bacterium]
MNSDCHSTGPSNPAGDATRDESRGREPDPEHPSSPHHGFGGVNAL